MQGNLSDSIFFFVVVGCVVKSSRAKLSLLACIPRFTHNVLPIFFITSAFMIQKQWCSGNIYCPTWTDKIIGNTIHGDGNKDTLVIYKRRRSHVGIWFSNLILYTRDICRAILCQLYNSLHIRIHFYIHGQLNELIICNNIVDIETICNDNKTRINNYAPFLILFTIQWRYLERWPRSIWLQRQWSRWQKNVSSGSTNL